MTTHQSEWLKVKRCPIENVVGDVESLECSYTPEEHLKFPPTPGLKPFCLAPKPRPTLHDHEFLAWFLTAPEILGVILP